MCLGDRRLWHWSRVSPVRPTWVGATSAALLAVRFQLLVMLTQKNQRGCMYSAWPMFELMISVA